MSKKQESILQRDGTRSVLASLLSIIIGLAAGTLVILIVGPLPYRNSIHGFPLHGYPE